jgi:hypothetical protein
MRRFIVRLLIGFVLLGIAGQVAALIARRYFGHSANEEDDEFDLLNICGGIEFSSRAVELRAGNVRTVMGGTALDLRGAELAPGGAYLEVLTACGGTEIIVSRDWSVDVLGVPQAGGHEVDVADAEDLPDDAPHLVIQARTFAGGLEVIALPPDEAAAAEVEVDADVDAEPVESFD